MPVSVAATNGTPPPELNPGLLEGAYQQKPVIVRSVHFREELPRVMLLLDTSGSMKKRAEASIEVAEGLLSKLPASVEVGLAFFSKDAVPVASPTTDRSKLADQLESLRKNRGSWKGKTALWSALDKTVKMFGDQRTGDTIYIVSDGGENASSTKEKDVERFLVNQGVRVFAFLITSVRSRAIEEVIGPVNISKVIAETGGIEIFSDDSTGPFTGQIALADVHGKPTRVGSTMNWQVVQLLNCYYVEIELPEPVEKAKDWKLSLAGLSKSQRDNLVLAYPSQLMPCR